MKKYWVEKLSKYGFLDISAVNIEKEPASGYEFFFSAIKDGQKVFIKCGTGTYEAEKEYNVCLALHTLADKYFPKPFMYKNLEDNKIFFAMEYVEGITLDKISYPELSDKVLNNIFNSLCDIAKVLYDNSCIHRDTHWSNFIVQNSGLVKIIDFQHLLGLNYCEEKENIENPKILRGTNKKLRPAPFVWDDMYSICRILKKFPKERIIDYNQKISDIQSKIGKQGYYFLDNKFNLKTYFTFKFLILYKILNFVYKPFRKF